MGKKKIILTILIIVLIIILFSIWSIVNFSIKPKIFENCTVKISWWSYATAILINVTNSGNTDFNITVFNDNKLELNLVMITPNGIEYSMNASGWSGMIPMYRNVTLKPGEQRTFTNTDLELWRYYFPERFIKNG
ncbi:MAG: hypothetical protein AB1485_07030, partial [Candidatus Thermoplasmatota archaeon]